MGTQLENDQRLGEINYAGYVNALPSKTTWDGKPLPVWKAEGDVKQLSDAIRGGWQGGAEAVAKEVADPIYLERARVLALATKALQALGVRCGLGQHSADDAEWDPEWRTIVFVDLPTGQATWHLHDSQVPLFAHLPPYDAPWDGHTTEEKYARLEAFCAESR